MITLVLKGMIIGFAIAAPVGPIGLLCIQRSLQDGFKCGLMTGLGAASADGIYGAIAAFGLTAISGFLMHQLVWIRVLGGLALLILGVKLWRKPVQKIEELSQSEANPWHAYLTTFFLTLTNPATIMSFVIIFASLGIVDEHLSSLQAIFMVLSITIGSAFWWLLLSSCASFIRKFTVTQNLLQLINRISAVILCGFGVVTLIIW